MEEFEKEQQIQQEAKQSFDHLSLKEKLKHSSYDARRTGVEELIKIFKQETNFNGGVFSEHEGSTFFLIFFRHSSKISWRQKRDCC
jgi:hypothetical protein